MLLLVLLVNITIAKSATDALSVALFYAFYN